MKIQKEPLYFVGHQGLMEKLRLDQGTTMYIPDSNLVMKLLHNKGSANQSLSEKHKQYLSISKASVRVHWHHEKKWIPVNPTLALMELSKQHQKPNLTAYLNLFDELFGGVYGIYDVAPEWVISTYFAAMQAHISTYPSISNTVQKTYSLIPPQDKPSDTETLRACEKLFQWIWLEKDNLAMIGGPLLYLCVYAIAGSPDARKFIKYSKAKKGDVKSFADNVSWDLLYWLMLEVEYHRNAYQNTIICTSDHSLAELLSSRVNKGPRGQTITDEECADVESFGDLHPFKLSRLENTPLERKIEKLLLELLFSVNLVEQDTISIGFNEIRHSWR